MGTLAVRVGFIVLLWLGINAYTMKQITVVRVSSWLRGGEVSQY